MITVTKYNRTSPIADAWETLWNANPKLSYYQSLAYTDELLHHFSAYRMILRVSPVFFLFEEDSKPLMILPLFQRWFGKGYILFGYKAGFGYLNGVYAAGFDRFTECFRTLKDTHGISAIDARYVREDTELGSWMLQNCEQEASECTSLSLPEDYDTYLASLSKHMKQNIRTAYNRMNTDGMTMEFSVVPYREMPEALRQELLHMYTERQQKKYNRAGGALYQAFVRYVDLGTAIQHSERVTEDAFILHMNGKIAAYFDAIDCGKESIIPRLAIDDTFSRYSPGIVLLNESIKHWISRGMYAIDLTHGTEGYKLSMGGTVSRCLQGEIHF